MEEGIGISEIHQRSSRCMRPVRPTVREEEATSSSHSRRTKRRLNQSEKARRTDMLRKMSRKRNEACQAGLDWQKGERANMSKGKDDMNASREVELKSNNASHQINRSGSARRSARRQLTEILREARVSIVGLAHKTLIGQVSCLSGRGRSRASLVSALDFRVVSLPNEKAAKRHMNAST